MATSVLIGDTCTIGSDSRVSSRAASKGKWSIRKLAIDHVTDWHDCPVSRARFIELFQKGKRGQLTYTCSGPNGAIWRDVAVLTVLEGAS
jgi:hypothetical protein